MSRCIRDINSDASLHKKLPIVLCNDTDYELKSRKAQRTMLTELHRAVLHFGHAAQVIISISIFLYHYISDLNLTKPQLYNCTTVQFYNSTILKSNSANYQNLQIQLLLIKLLYIYVYIYMYIYTLNTLLLLVET